MTIALLSFGKALANKNAIGGFSFWMTPYSVIILRMNYHSKLQIQGLFQNTTAPIAISFTDAFGAKNYHY